MKNKTVITILSLAVFFLVGLTCPVWADTTPEGGYPLKTLLGFGMSLPPLEGNSIYYQKQLAVEPESALVYWKLAVAFYKQGSLVEARDAANEAITRDPKILPAFYLRGFINLSLDRAERTIEDCDVLIEAESNRSYHYLLRAVAYDDLNRDVEAIVDCNKAVELDSQKIQPYVIRGVIHLKMQEIGPAIADLDQAMLLAKDSSDKQKILLYRAIARMRSPEYRDLAIEDFTTLLDTAGSDDMLSRCYYLRGLTKAWQHKDDLARKDFLQATLQKPSVAEGLIWRAKAFFKLGKTADAMEDINSALQKNPYSSDAYLTKGTFEAKMERYEEAVKDFDKAIGFNPFNLVVLEKRVEVVTAWLTSSTVKGRHKTELAKRAASDLRKIIKVKTDQSSLVLALANDYMMLGTIEGELNELELAIQSLSEAIKLDPKNATAYYARARLYEKKKLNTLACNDYLTAAKCAGDLDDMYYKAGQGLQRLKRTDDALLCYSNAITMNNTKATYYIARAKLELESNNTKAAIADCSVAIRLEPTQYMHYLERSLAYAKCGERELSDKDFKKAEKLGYK
jgi:tetratricopeptide (TPR) repeat protein